MYYATKTKTNYFNIMYLHRKKMMYKIMTIAVIICIPTYYGWDQLLKNV